MTSRSRTRDRGLSPAPLACPAQLAANEMFVVAVVEFIHMHIDIDVYTFRRTVQLFWGEESGGGTEGGMDDRGMRKGWRQKGTEGGMDG